MPRTFHPRAICEFTSIQSAEFFLNEGEEVSWLRFFEQRAQFSTAHFAMNYFQHNSKFAVNRSCTFIQRISSNGKNE